MGTKGMESNMKMAELIPDIIPKEKKPLEPPLGMDEEDEEFDEDYDDEEDYKAKKNN